MIESVPTAPPPCLTWTSISGLPTRSLSSALHVVNEQGSRSGQQSRFLCFACGSFTRARAKRPSSNCRAASAAESRQTDPISLQRRELQLRLVASRQGSRTPCLSGFRDCRICDPLPPVAPAGLFLKKGLVSSHRCSFT